MTKYTFKRVSKRKSQCRSWLIWYPQHRKPQKSLLQLIKSVKQTTNNVLGFCATKLFKKFFYFHLVFVLTNETSQLYQIFLNLFKFPQTSLMEFPQFLYYRFDYHLYSFLSVPVSSPEIFEFFYKNAKMSYQKVLVKQEKTKPPGYKTQNERLKLPWNFLACNQYFSIFFIDLRVSFSKTVIIKAQFKL